MGMALKLVMVDPDCFFRRKWPEINGDTIGEALEKTPTEL
jgi:hypothetical protein